MPRGCGMWVYARIPHQPDAPGWFSVYGTSLAAPMFAGIAALADQQAGHPHGQLNPLLYRLHGTADGLLNIIEGNGTAGGVRGYSAGPRYDPLTELTSGIGTVGLCLRGVPGPHFALWWGQDKFSESVGSAGVRFCSPVPPAKTRRLPW